MAKPNLRLVFFLAFSLTSIVPILLLGSWVVDSARHNEYEGVKDKHLLVAKNLTHALSRYTQDIEAVLTHTSYTYFKSDTKPLLELLNSKHVRTIRVFNKKAFQVSGKNTRTGAELSIMTSGQLERIRRVADTEKVVFLPIKIGEDNKPTILVVSPCYVYEGYFYVAELESNYVIELQKKIKFGKGGHAAIVDQVGSIIAHPNSDWVALAKNISKVSSVQRMMNRETGVEKFYSPAKEEDMIAGFSFVEETGWGVMIPQPVSELEERIAHIKSVAINVSGLGFAFSMLISWFLASKLTQSTRRIASIVQRLTLNESIEEIPIIPAYTREQQNLCDAFSRMTHSLNLKNTELLYNAQHDVLTGLANRSLLSVYLNEKVAGEKPFFLILLDLNDFKDINDHWSHAHGDKLLIAVSERLVNIVNNQGIVSRIGGDEFAIAFNAEISREQVEKTVVLLIKELTNSYPILQEILQIGCSLGLAYYPDDAGNISDLMQCADLAMYSAKKQPNTNHLWYKPSMRLALNERVELTQAFREAIQLGQFVIHYQPKVDIHTNRISGLEALVRWNHPVKGLIYPGTFIQLAESTGLIIPLGELILDLICQDISLWEQQDVPLCVVSMNLSTRQFENHNLASKIKKTISKYNISATKLEFEITESIFMNSSTQVKDTLVKLSNLGSQISVDDFGTGESSLARLKDFDVDIIKIDKSFVDDLEINKKTVDILRCIVDMAQVLGLRVVVEGVETATQLKIVKQLNCSEVQGFIFSRAVDAVSIVHLLKSEVMTPIE